MRHPFLGLRELIAEADLAFANLSMPLSERARRSGEHLGHPAFADALRWAGFDVVSTANAHAMDGEVPGLLDTHEALWRAGVGQVGSGPELEEARRPHTVEAGGLSVAFLGYTSGPASAFVGYAWGEEWRDTYRGFAGVMPLDPLLIEEDVRRVRAAADYVAVSVHWPVPETSLDVHPDARAFARRLIDAGADVILGHHPHGALAASEHPHLPRGVEVYDGKVILYSLGNLVFGHGHTLWGDNYLARLTLTPERITQVEIVPVAGRGNDLAQPYPLAGERARSLLEQVQDASARLGTRMEIVGDVGVIRP